MNLVSRTITGGILIGSGLILIAFSIYTQFSTLVHGILVLIIGIFVFLNKKEDVIEKIKKGGKK